MTFDEALAHPGPRLAAWDLTDGGDGRTLTIFSLDGDRARALAHRGVRPGEEGALALVLRARGLSLGECDSRCEFAWRAEADGVSVWSPRWRVLRAEGGTLGLVNGRTIARGDIERIRAYAADDRVERGVRARLRSGEEVALVREVSSAAAADPTYSRNELLYDTAWAVAIAAAVAAWAGVPCDDEISGG